MTSRPWIVRARLWLLAAFTYAYFVSGGGPNQATRFALTESIIERHTTDITAVHYRSIDKGYRNGTFYADKAPGMSLLAIPPYLVMRAADAVFRIPTDTRAAQNAKQYLLTLLLSGAAGVAVAWLLTRLLLALGCSDRAAELVGFAYAFGTIAFPFATVFFGHQLATLLTFAPLVVAVETRNRGTLARPRTLVGLGVLWGTSLLVEYPTGLLVAVFGLAVVAWTFDRTKPVASVLRTLALTSAGGAPIVLGHALFLFVVYGKVSLPYSFVSEPFFRAHMSGGFLGIDVPTKLGLYGSLFSMYRGLFFFCPVLVLSFVGLGCWIDSKADRRPLPFVVAALAIYLVFATSYYAWDGGGSAGPRHLLPWIPLAMVPIGFFVDRFRWAFPLTLALALVSAVLMLATTYTLVQLPVGDPYTANPIYDVILPAIANGAGPISPVDSFIPYPRSDAATNWGLLLGLGARASLLLVPCVWLAAYLPGVVNRLRRIPAHA